MIHAPYKSGCEEQRKGRNYFDVVWFSSQEGYGCVASTDIPRYTLILEEEPLICGKEIDLALEWHRKGQLKCQEEDKVFLSEVCCLTEEQQIKFWYMHDQYRHHYDNSKDLKRIWGIVHSNGIQNTNQNYQHGLYFLTSKFNHSCSPNIGYEVSADWNMRVWSSRDIRKGEALHLGYSDVVYHFPRKVRQEFLLEGFKFFCQCTVCGPSNSTIEQSDRRRIHLKELAIRLRDCLGIDFLYNPVFCMEVKRISNMKKNNDPASHEKASNEVNSKAYSPERRKTRDKRRRATDAVIPEKKDLENLVEYIQLLEDEKLDHDILQCYELAYNLAVFLKAESKLTNNLGSKCLELFTVSFGDTHSKTKAIRNKLHRRTKLEDKGS